MHANSGRNVHKKMPGKGRALNIETTSREYGVLVLGCKHAAARGVLIQHKESQDCPSPQMGSGWFLLQVIWHHAICPQHGRFRLRMAGTDDCRSTSAGWYKQKTQPTSDLV